MDAKTRAAEGCLRRLEFAVKVYTLYPASHPMYTQAVASLGDDLHRYAAAHGPLTVRVAKNAFAVDGATFDGGAHGNLAFFFFTRRLAGLTVKPAVTVKELGSFLSIMSMDRLHLEAASGVAYLLWQADVKNIEVVELTLEQEAVQETLGLNAFNALIGRGRLTPQERERIIEILRPGADQAAMLLDNLYTATEKAFDGITEEERVAFVYQTVRSLDRVILDEPMEEQPPLRSNLAAAQLHVSGGLGARLQRMLISNAESDPAIGQLIDRLSADQVAQVVFGALAPGDVTHQVVEFLRPLGNDQEKVEATLASLEKRLRPEQHPAGRLIDVVLPQIQPDPARCERRSFAASDGDSSLVVIEDEESEQRIKEARSIDETAAIREVIRTLVEVLHYEEDEESLTALAGSLEGHLPWVVEHREFELLGEILAGLKDIEGSGSGRRSMLAVGILKKVTDGHLLEALLEALWNARGTPVQGQIHACFQVLAGRAVSHLVRVLAEEPRAPMRAALCDLLVGIGRDHVDTLGAYVNDPRWYLVRNIASILGRLQDPRAVVHLRTLSRHSEYRVRRETVDALANISTEQAVALLVGFIDDPDPRIQVRTVESLDAGAAQQAVPKLMALLKARDPFHRQFELRRAAIEVLGLVGGQEVLPTLQSLARRHLALSRRSRELRRLAATAAGNVERRLPRAPGALVTTDRV